MINVMRADRAETTASHWSTKRIHFQLKLAGPPTWRSVKSDHLTSQRFGIQFSAMETKFSFTTITGLDIDRPNKTLG